MTNNTQLPAEVVERIDKEAETANLKNKDRVNSYRFGYVAGYNDGATEYDTKLHLCNGMYEQAKEELKQGVAKLHRAQQENRDLRISLTTQAKTIDTLMSQNDTARTLLEKVKSRHEAGLLPDRFIYEIIKKHLDGK